MEMEKQIVPIWTIARRQIPYTKYIHK